MNILKLLLPALALVGSRGVQAQLNYVCEYNTATNECTLVSAAGTPADPVVKIPANFTNPADNKSYKLVMIKAGAMNGILGMKELTIPAGVHTIGNVSSTRNQSARVAELDNFRWCPDLEKITVESGNPTFKTTAAGVLTSYDGNNVYRVPSRFFPTDGIYKMSTTGIRIARHAFNQCSLINKIVFSNSLDYVDPQSDIWTMKELKEFEIPAGGSGERNFMIDNKALIEKASKTLVAVPAAGSDEGAFVVNSSSVTAIGAYAFAKTKYNRVTVSAGVKSIGERAFYNSGISTIIIPASVNAETGLGEGCFEKSAIESITTQTTADLTIPAACFRNCEKLNSVQFQRAPAKIGQAAFKNCTSLSQYLYFSGRTSLEGDSIWAGSGLQQAIFFTSNLNTSAPSGIRATFNGCSHLEEIEMRAINGYTTEKPFVCGKDFATNCPQLNKITMPAYTHFAPGAFSINNNLRTVVVGNFTYEEAGIFRFNSDSPINPTTYVYAPEDTYTRFVTPVEGLYKNIGSGSFNGRFFMAPTITGIQSLVEGGSYFVPGGAVENYPGGNVTPLYDFWVTGTGSQSNLYFSQPFTGLVFNAVEIHDSLGNYRREIIPSGGGDIVAPMNFHALTLVTVEYTLFGNLMRSTYNKDLLPNKPQSGIGNTEVALPGISFRNGALEIPEGSTCTVYDLSGRVMGNETCVESLSTGFYIARASRGSEQLNLKFKK